MVANSHRSFCGREWQARRFVLTKTAIHFAFQDEELEIDHIPLAEIVLIDLIKDSDVGVGIGGESEQTVGDGVIHIATEQGGHNSGRGYYLQTETTVMENLISTIRVLSREARKNRDNHNIFQRAQIKVRRVYEARPSQALICLFIGMVIQISVDILSYFLLTLSRAMPELRDYSD